MTPIRQFARLALAASLLALPGCSPQAIDIRPCAVGSKLAFWIEDSDGWFLDTTPRPTSVMVFERFKGPRWEAQLPFALRESAQEKFRPKRKIIRYGDTFPGWDIATAPRPLVRNTTYVVEIWTDGGRGLAEFTGGAQLPPCASLTDD